MATVNADMRQYALNNGNTYGQDKPNNSKASEMDKMLMQMAMAQKMKPLTLLGMLLGNLLGQGVNSWRKNYDARGDLNDQITSKSPDELDAWLKDMEGKDPEYAARLRTYASQPRFQQKMAQAPAGAQPDAQAALQSASGAEQQPVSDIVRQRAMQAATQGQDLFGDGGQMAQAAQQNNSPFPTANSLMQPSNEEELRRLLMMIGGGGNAAL